MKVFQSFKVVYLLLNIEKDKALRMDDQDVNMNIMMPLFTLFMDSTQMTTDTAAKIIDYCLNHPIPNLAPAYLLAAYIKVAPNQYFEKLLGMLKEGMPYFENHPKKALFLKSLPYPPSPESWLAAAKILIQQHPPKQLLESLPDVTLLVDEEGARLAARDRPSLSIGSLSNSGGHPFARKESFRFLESSRSRSALLALLIIFILLLAVLVGMLMAKKGKGRRGAKKGAPEDKSAKLEDKSGKDQGD